MGGEDKRNNIYKVDVKNITKTLFLFSSLLLLVAVGIGILNFLYVKNSLFWLIATVLIAFSGIFPTLYLISQPLVSTLVKYYLTGGKLVLVVNPKARTLEFKIGVVRGNYLFIDKNPPIILDSESIYSIGKGHNIILYKGGMVKTLRFDTIRYVVIDDVENKEIVYEDEPVMLLKTKDVNDLIDYIESFVASKKKEISRGLGGISIAGKEISFKWILLLIAIVVIVVLAFVVMNNGIPQPPTPEQLSKPLPKP